MTTPFSVDALLIALRETGLRVGFTEMERLRQVFNLEPDFSGGDHKHNRHRLKAILRTILIKSEEDRNTFERVYDAWLNDAEQELRILNAPVFAPAPIETRSASERPQAHWRDVLNRIFRKRREWWYAAAATVALTVVIAVGFLFEHYAAGPETTVPLKKSRPDQIEPLSRTNTKPISLEDVRNVTFRSWVPVLRVRAAEPVWKGWFSVELGALALLTGIGLWIVLSKRRWLPDAAPDPTRPGPPRVFVQPAPLAGPQLLDARQQEALVWGIGRFMADEPTRRLDLSATVNATARRGGVPDLRFHHAYYDREVWLWVDKAADDSAIIRLTDEVEATLRVHGLAVERAAFRGIPDQLITETGAVFAPREIDERRNSALVAVLSDGRLLTRQYTADDRRVRIDGLLRGLSHWPRLAFVDFSDGANSLAAILRHHDLERIAPTELAAFLGGGVATIAQQREPPRDDAAWAAACAIAPSSVDEATAFVVRQRLGLATSTWALRALHAEAPGPAGRLQWRPGKRAQRVNWLRDAEANVAADGVAKDSLLNRTIGLWEEIYKEALEDGGVTDSSAFRTETLAQQHLLMESYLLRLWRRPDEAIPELYRLFGGKLQEAVRQQLRQLGPHDGGEGVFIRLPWSWAERTATEKAMLQAMHFGGNMPTEKLRRPGRLWLGFAACLGLAAGGFLGAAFSGWKLPENRPPSIVHDLEHPTDEANEVRITAADDGRWRVSVTTPQSIGYVETGDAAQVDVDWQWVERPCVERLKDNAEIWHCGETDQPVRVENIQRSLAVLVAEPGSLAVEKLAVDLLSSGSADVVMINSNWPRHREALLDGQKELGPGEQLLVVSVGETYRDPETVLLPGDHRLFVQAKDWVALRKALRFNGEQLVLDTWSGLLINAIGDKQQVMLRGVSAGLD